MGRVLKGSLTKPTLTYGYALWLNEAVGDGVANRLLDACRSTNATREGNSAFPRWVLETGVSLFGGCGLGAAIVPAGTKSRVNMGAYLGRLPVDAGIRGWADSGNRKVYVSGVVDRTLDWTGVDGEGKRVKITWEGSCGWRDVAGTDVGDVDPGVVAGGAVPMEVSSTSSSSTSSSGGQGGGGEDREVVLAQLETQRVVAEARRAEVEAETRRAEVEASRAMLKYLIDAGMQPAEAAATVLQM